MKEKTYVEDVNRSIYDIRNEEKDVYRVKEGLTPEIVDQISKEKHDPDWMREFRQEALKVYNEMTMPDWGPSIEDLNMDRLLPMYVPNTQMSAKWPRFRPISKIRLKALGIPDAERTSLAGVGAQYDSELVYHNVRVKRLLQHRALSTPTWRARSRANTPRWCISIS